MDKARLYPKRTLRQKLKLKYGLLLGGKIWIKMI